MDEAFLPYDIAAKFLTENTSTAKFRDPASVVRDASYMECTDLARGNSNPLAPSHGEGDLDEPDHQGQASAGS